MKYLWMLLCMLTCTMLYADNKTSKSIYELTTAGKEAQRQAIRYKRTGGFIVRREPNAGSFAFINTQTKVSPDVFTNEIKDICRICKIDYFIKNREWHISPYTARKAFIESKGNAALFITEIPEMLETILIAPESRWGIINVSALQKDSPSKEVLEKRLKREIWRGFSMVAGSHCTEMAHCLLNPVLSLRDLDEIDGNTFSPEPLSRMAKNLRKMGITPYYRCTYKSACRQGWAPPPTNDVQKAIWEDVKKKVNKK